MTKDVDAYRVRASAEQKLGLEYVRACFEVRDSVVYWRDRPLSHFADEHAWKVFQSKYAGKPAGRKEANGYATINMRHNGHRVQFQAHRVVWAFHHGRWPTMGLDHINRVRDDNRVENLREATTAENNKNSASKRVHPYVAEHKWGGFNAQVRIGDTNVHLGVFETAEEARAHREMVCAELVTLGRSLAKKSKTGRRRKDHHTFSHQTPPKDGKC